MCKYLGDGDEEMRKSAAGAVSALGENDYTNQVSNIASTWLSPVLISPALHQQLALRKNGAIEGLNAILSVISLLIDRLWFLLIMPFRLLSVVFPHSFSH